MFFKAINDTIVTKVYFRNINKELILIDINTIS